MNESVHKHGNRQGLDVFFGPCHFDREQNTLRSLTPDQLSVLDHSVEGLRILDKQCSTLTPGLSSAWTDPVAGGGNLSSLDSQLANYPSVLLSKSSPWWMEKEEPHITTGE